MAMSSEVLDDLPAMELQQSVPGSRWMRPVEIVCAALLTFIITILLVGVIARYVFSSPLIWVDESASFAFLWFAMLGAAIAIDRHEHLRLTVFLHLLDERKQAFVASVGLLLTAVFLGSLLYPAFDYAMEESYVTSASLLIPMSYRASALPVGLALMMAIVILHGVRIGNARMLIGAAVLVGAAGGALFALEPVFTYFGNWNIVIFLVFGVGLLLAMGVPIAFCFGLGALSFLTFTTSMPTFVIIGRMDEGMSSIILLSVPIFVLLGCVLDATGMGKAIVEVLASLLGHVKAGMSYVLLGSMFLVSGISGSKVSDMATVAPALFPEMKRRGHKPPEMIALLATGAAMAETVPPSIVLIVLGSTAGVSIAGLFTSGFAIAMVLLLVLAVLARWKSRHESMEGVRRASVKTVWKAVVIAAPALLLPFLIRSAVGGGVATATEVSTIAVLYALIIGATLYGGISLKKLYTMLVETAALSGAILIILGCASAMAWALTQTGFAFKLAQAVTDLPGGWLTFMGVTVLMFMVLGCVLEGLPAIVLMAPIMFPIAKSLGINDVHYSMVVVTAMNVGLIAPPIGIGFYIACKIGGVAPDEAMKAIWPYIGALLIGLFLIAVFPIFSIALL
ncbi:tripartite ATP-independent transporter DctM subunit [Neorhizobium huautlense]|uniref:Tripartite ATP-independent transporter DctM subunit n=1 Tax=Neorhizobium huautlense TaxID=67774 RepID=A0ABT9PP28_9HYPH|nr:TRAP transporter large permease subunit [Neorhizobium huautlense]MDP9836228.1 tripartite ATP-independent transporter DctM subunit [Neorhizobium huautlense]